MARARRGRMAGSCLEYFILNIYIYISIYWKIQIGSTGQRFMGRLSMDLFGTPRLLLNMFLVLNPGSVLLTASLKW
jgi:hypothetical protein